MSVRVMPVENCVVVLRAREVDLLHDFSEFDCPVPSYLLESIETGLELESLPRLDAFELDTLWWPQIDLLVCF